MNKQYARTNYSNRDFITAGKLYLIKKYDGDNFEITGDNGEWVYCAKFECQHLDGNDWEIIEESETMNVLTGKQGMQTAVMDWAEEQVNRGRWVDIVWDADLKSCAARVGAAGAWEKQVDGYGETELEARIELMRAWDAIYGEAAELDRVWKAFVSGLPDGVQAWRYDNDGRHKSVVSGEDGEILKYVGKDEAATKRGLMAAWAAING